jgi:hypothetical protein
MRRVFHFLILLGFSHACKSPGGIDPNDYMTMERQRAVINKLIRYAAKLAPTADHETKFDPQFDPYYNAEAQSYAFMYLHEEDNVDGGYWFLISRPARSTKPMYEGIGGRLELNKADSLITYDEVFRTWKMQYSDLQSRGKYLFEQMRTGQDLSPFYSRMAGDKYIEFPDDRFKYDIKERRWKDAVADSLSVE